MKWNVEIDLREDENEVETFDAKQTLGHWQTENVGQTKKMLSESWYWSF